MEARHLKAGDLLQNPEGKLYPIDRIEIKNDITTVYNFRVEGVHNYFITELEIWTHNCGAGGMRNIPMSAPSGGGAGSSTRGTNNVSKYENITSPGSRYHNRETNVNRSEFEKNLSDAGWNKTSSKDGKVQIYEKDGSRYSIRENAKSTNGPTADFYKAGSPKIDTKIRLGSNKQWEMKW